MRKSLVAAIAAASLLSVPAFAQTNAATPSTPAPATRSGSPSTASTMQAREKIMHDLQQDGFKNIRVAPESFLIHAENKQGEPVVMIINPDSVFSMTEVATTASAHGSTARHNATPNTTGSTTPTGTTTE
jgi:hypothetical protein